MHIKIKKAVKSYKLASRAFPSSKIQSCDKVDSVGWNNMAWNWTGLKLLLTINDYLQKLLSVAKNRVLYITMITLVEGIINN